MSPFSFTLLFALAVLAMVVTKLWLASRQIRFVAAHRNDVPAQFSATIPLTAHQRAADYTVERTRLTMLEIVVSAAVLVGLTLLGGVGALDTLLTGWIGRGYGQQVALVAAVLVITSVIDVPFEYYRQFGIEQRFGFNRMTKRLFFTDMLKNSLLGAALGLPLLFVVLWLMNQAGSLWWLWTWIVWVAFQMLVLLIYLTFIAPIFNKFEPLKDDALRAHRVADEALRLCGEGAVRDGRQPPLGARQRVLHGLRRIEADRVLRHAARAPVRPGNRSRARARTRPLQAPPRDEADARVVRAEPRAARPARLAGATHVVLHGAGVTPSLDTSNAGAALVLFFLAIPVFLFFATPLGSLTSRKHEFEADAFAASQTDAQDLVSALVKLYEDNASTLTPDPVYTAFYYSHPPASQRIDRLMQHA